MSKHRRRQRRLMFYHDGRPQTMTRQGALKKSFLCVQEWPEYECLTAALIRRPIVLSCAIVLPVK
jgi:hypothetical protein